MSDIGSLVKRLRESGDTEAADTIERLVSERDHYWPYAPGKSQ